MKQQIIKISGKPDITKDDLWSWVTTYIQRYKDGTRFEWSITIKKRLKSDPQRKMYFSKVLPELMSAVGYDPHEAEDVHRFLKIKFFWSQANVLEKCGLEPIIKDKHGYHKNVPRLFHKKSQIPVNIRSKFIDWAMRIAIEYGAEF